MLQFGHIKIYSVTLEFYQNKSTPSYESLGRRPRRSTNRMNSSSQNVNVNFDASIRTSSLSHAIATLALLSASICQLRFLATYSSAHSYPFLNYFLISISIVLEVKTQYYFTCTCTCTCTCVYILLWDLIEFHNY